MYSTDLAYIHHRGFGDFARRVGPDVVRILQSHGICRGLVVEVGCGSGTLARHLTDRGYDVVGFDISPAMVRLARVAAPGARFRVGSLAGVRIPPCVAVVSVGEVVAYVPGGRKVLQRFFMRAHDALEPGGLLIFDFIASARGRTFRSKTKSGTGWSIAVRARFDRSSGILTRAMSMTRTVGARVRRSRETHRVRIYRRRDMMTAVARAGFAATPSRSIGGTELLASDLAIVARKVAAV